jgi:hypothetical protein
MSNSHKVVGIKAFLTILHDDRRIRNWIRSRIHTCDQWIRIDPNNGKNISELKFFGKIDIKLSGHQEERYSAET